MMMEPPPPAPFFCVNCGHSATQIYKTYGALIKLIPCKFCDELVDKYVEYDRLIVIVNLILLSKTAYRHVLLNNTFQGFWKLAVIFLFADAYYLQKSVPLLLSNDLEINFYKALLRTLISTFCFHSIVFLSTVICKSQNCPPIYHHRSGRLLLWKGLCLSGSIHIFQFIDFIWMSPNSTYSNNPLRLCFFKFIFLLSNMQSYYVTTGLSHAKSFLIVTTSLCISRYVISFYDMWIPL